MRHAAAGGEDDCTPNEIKCHAIESAMLPENDLNQRARRPCRREVAPFVTTSCCGLTLDAGSQPPLSRALNHQAAQSRRAAPGENNCWPKPVDWPLPPTLPLDSRRQLLAAGTCRPSPAPRRAPPARASNRHSNSRSRRQTVDYGKGDFFSLARHMSRTTLQAARAGVHMHICIGLA